MLQESTKVGGGAGSRGFHPAMMYHLVTMLAFLLDGVNYHLLIRMQSYQICGQFPGGQYLGRDDSNSLHVEFCTVLGKCFSLRWQQC